MEETNDVLREEKLKTQAAKTELSEKHEEVQ